MLKANLLGTQEQYTLLRNTASFSSLLQQSFTLDSKGQNQKVISLQCQGGSKITFLLFKDPISHQYGEKKHKTLLSKILNSSKDSTKQRFCSRQRWSIYPKYNTNTHFQTSPMLSNQDTIHNPEKSKKKIYYEDCQHSI